MIRITCQCCYQTTEYKAFTDMNLALATYWMDSPIGAMCGDCYTQVAATEPYNKAAEEAKQLRLSGIRDAVKEVQDSHNFKPAEIKSIH